MFQEKEAQSDQEPEIERVAVKIKALMLGLDQAGKTTILYRMKLGEVISAIATNGFNYEEIKYKNYDFEIWDVGGKEDIRPLWQNYYKDNPKAIIFVVDAHETDPQRIQEAADELQKLMNLPQLKEAPFLIYANKHDLPKAMDSSEIAEKFNLEGFKDQKWFIQACCAKTGEGLYQGLDYLMNHFDNDQAE
uniref:ADP-ribosylation factor n=1 Tax=Trepomonas sp. PC1 TaxID=1076344 RepID=A0A146KCA4_9EUKA|eukprot:JAP92999.1 ADP-ribosylation factor [Trepomonas sp. PC1]